MNDEYKYSVFYFAQSIYEIAGTNLARDSVNNFPFKLIFKSSLINPRYKKLLGMHITYTTDQILELVKGENYSTRFKGIIQLGENIAYPEECNNMHGDKNFKLLQCATNKDGEVIGRVKVVADDYETKQYFQKMILEHKYPLDIISSEEALRELIEIEKELVKEYG